MNANEFQQAARRTAQGGVMPPVDHWIIGLFGEAHEMLAAYAAFEESLEGTPHFDKSYERKRKALISELGDMHWYLANLLSEYDMPYSEAFATVDSQYQIVDALADPDYDRHLYNNLSVLAEHVKKLVNYVNKPIDNRVDLYAWPVAYWLNIIGLKAGISLEEVWQFNVDKLLARYPNGFNGGNAQDR